MRDAFRIVRAVPRRPEGDDLRLGPHAARRPALRADPRASPRRSPTTAGWSSPAPGPGSWPAGMEGAGREQSIGVSIRLPFETSANPVIAGDPKLVTMKYFFTRKLMLMKESHGVRVAARRVRHARRGVRAADARCRRARPTPAPIVLLDVPGGTYWTHWREFVVDELARQAAHRGPDVDLFLVTDDVEAACDEIVGFYRTTTRCATSATARDPACATARCQDDRDARRATSPTSPARAGSTSSLRCPRRSRTTTGSTWLASRSGSAATTSPGCRGAHRRAQPLSPDSRRRRARAGSRSPSRRATGTGEPPLVDGQLGAARVDRLAEADDRQVGQLLGDRLEPSRGCRRTHRPSSRLVDDLHRMADVDARGGEVQRAARVGAGDDVGTPARSIAASLRSRIAPASSGCSAEYAPPAPQHSPSSSSSTSCDVRLQHRAHRQVGALHVAQMARVLDRDAIETRARRAAAARRMRGASHSCTSWTRAAKRLGLRRAEQVAVVLQRRAASGGVDDDRRVAGHRRHHASGEPSGVVGEAGVHVQRAAAVAALCRAARRRTGRGRAPGSTAACTWRCHASITQPVNSHTSLPVGSSGERRSGQLRHAEARRDALRNEMSRCATASTVDPASRSRWCPSAFIAEPLPPRREPTRGGERVAACPSISRPNGTLDGHAVSQPRHCTQASMKPTNASSGSAPSQCTARIAAMRPRGDAASSPVTR